MKRSRGPDQQPNGTSEPPPGEQGPRRAVQWNEENLEENEQIKADLRPIRCNEPKTPFHRPASLDEDPEEPDVPSMDTDGRPPESCSSMEANGFGEGVHLQDVVDRLPKDGDPQHRSSDMDSDGEAGPRSRRRHKFKDHRKAHYKMKQAIERGKELASQSLSDAAEDEQEEEISSAMKE